MSRFIELTRLATPKRPSGSSAMGALLGVAAVFLMPLFLIACGSPSGGSRTGFSPEPSPHAGSGPAPAGASTQVSAQAEPVEKRRLGLAEVRARVLAHADPRLAALAERIKEAEGRGRQSNLWPNPYFKLRKVRMDHDGPFGSGFWEFVLGQRFELAGKRGKREAEAAAMTNIARAELSSAVREALRDAERGFFRILRLQDERAVAASEAKTLEDRVTLDVARVEAGRENRFAVLRAEAEAERARLDVVSLERAHDAACRRLDRALGLAVGTVSGVEGAWEAATVSAVDRDRLRASLAEHPRVVAAARAKTAADRTLDRADADAWPDVTPFFILTRDDEFRETTPGFGVRLDLPLSSRNQGTREAAQAARRRAEKTLAAERLALDVALDTALISHDEFTAKVDAYDRIIVPRLEGAFELTERAREAGKVSRLAVLEARVRLLQAQRMRLRYVEERARAATELAYLVKVPG